MTETLFPDLTVPQLLQRAIEVAPDKPAVISGGRRISYRDLGQRVARLAAQLAALGIKPGDRVGIDLPNWPEFVVTYFAVARLGAVIVPISTRLRGLEVEYILGHSGVSTLVTASRFADFDYLSMIADLRPQLPALEHVVAVGDIPTEHRNNCIAYESLLQVDGPAAPPVATANPAQDVVLILYTSGTTGKPKGVMLTHRNIVWTGFNENRGMEVTDRDSFLLVVPFFHVFGAVVGIICATAAAAPMVVLDTFRADDVLAAVEREKCTVIYGAPTMFILELNSPNFGQFDLGSLRTGIIAAAPCPVEVVKDIMTRMHCDIAVSYGLTETSPALTITSFDDPPDKRAETVGRALPGIELKVVDDERREVPRNRPGELACRGYAVMKGYYKQPEQTAEIIDTDGWLYTGDMAVMDDGGYVKIVGRKKDMVKRGGFAIFPPEVENYLYTHSSVQEAAIIGIPDPVLGERSRAYIILKPGTTATEQEIIDFCKGNIADYKVPDQVRFVATLPLTPSGKVRKVDLREMAMAELVSSKQ